MTNALAPKVSIASLKLLVDSFENENAMVAQTTLLAVGFSICSLEQPLVCLTEPPSSAKIGINEIWT